MSNQRNRRRAWSVYATDGTRIAELLSTTAAIRATLPNALIDEEQGIVRMVRVDLGLGIPPPLVVPEADYDAE